MQYLFSTKKSFAAPLVFAILMFIFPTLFKTDSKNVFLEKVIAVVLFFSIVVILPSIPIFLSMLSLKDAFFNREVLSLESLEIWGRVSVGGFKGSIFIGIPSFVGLFKDLGWGSTIGIVASSSGRTQNLVLNSANFNILELNSSSSKLMLLKSKFFKF